MREAIRYLSVVVALVAGLWQAGSVQAQEASFDLHAALAAAQPGATIIVPPGVYSGALTIDQPVTLEGQGLPVIDGAGMGSVITVNAPDVTIRGFVIRNSGDSLDAEDAGISAGAPRLTLEHNRLEDTLFGIYLHQAPDSVIRNNIIHAKDLDIARRGDGLKIWYSHNTLIEGNRIDGSRDALVWYSDNNIIRNNTVENSRYGFHLMNSDHQTLAENVLRNNSVGIYIMYGRDVSLHNNLIAGSRGNSGYGLGLKDSDDVTVEGNRLTGNRIGVYIDNSPREPSAFVKFHNNLFAYNEIGALMLPLVMHNTFTDNIFQDNGEQIAISGSGQLKENNWSHAGRGNYWSDYAGFDADHDAIGDLPYTPMSLYESLLARAPELRIFALSPAMDALDLAAKAFPIFQPQPKLSDGHPLTVAPALPSVPGLPVPPVAANLAVALGLIALAAGILFLSAYRRNRVSL